MPGLGRVAALGVGAVGAALAASACCGVPFGLAAFGLGAALAGAGWAAYRPLFAGLALFFLGAAFVQANRRTAAVPAAACERSRSRRARQVVFWLAVGLTLLALAYPWLQGAAPAGPGLGGPRGAVDLPG